MKSPLNLKKILILAGFVVLVLVLGYLLYVLFFKPTFQAPPEQQLPEGGLLPGQLPQLENANVGQLPETNVNGGLPEIGRIKLPPSDIARGGLTKISQITNMAVKGATIGPDGSFIYYDPVSGKFYRRLSDGTIVPLTAQAFHQVSDVTWSKDATQAVLEYPDGSNILYNFKTNKQATLPKEMQDFNFSNNGSKIAAQVIGKTEESNWLVTSNPDGSGIKFIEPIGTKGDDVFTNWSPNEQVVAVFRDSYNADRQEIVFIGQNKENFKSLITQGRGFKGQWAASGSKLLYSVYSQNDNFRPRLWITDAQGDNLGLNNTALNINTWADKCTINASGNRAYCAVPRDLPFGSGWYPELAKDSPDDFYSIDLATGQPSLLAIPSGDLNYSAKQVYLSPNEDKLYFIDQRDNKVYSMNLR